MTGAVRRPFADGRWHFQHGPIDCILSAEGDAEVVAACTERAWQRFRGVLDELVAELPLLRADLSSVTGAGVAPSGHGLPGAASTTRCAPEASTSPSRRTRSMWPPSAR